MHGPRVLDRLAPALLVTAMLLPCACDEGDAAPGEPEPARAAAPDPAPEAPSAPPDRDGSPWFVEEAAPRGLDFVHRTGHQEGRYLIPEMTAGGGVLFDMDDDGFLDVYLVQTGGAEPPPGGRPPNRLFRNRGDGTFEDVTAGSGADDRGYGTGATAGDYDGDGDVDLYVTNVGPNALLRNEGDGRFSDVTSDAGVGDDGYSTSAAFVDYDGDGDLDLFVLDYLVWSIESEPDCVNELGEPEYCAPAAYRAPAFDVLYRNDGDGTFTDVSAEANLTSAPGTGLGVVCADFDGDRLVDIFVANDGMRDRLWINLGDGRFEDRALLAGCAVDQDGTAKAGMGVTVADIDDDDDLDLVVCNMRGETDSMYRNEGDFFADITAVSGLSSASRSFTRFGMGWADFDNDTSFDLFQATGRVAREATSYRSDDRYAEPNLLFRGAPGGRLEEVAPRGGTRPLLVATSRGAAFGDIDNDGGVDVLVINRDGPVHLLRNVVENRGHWVMFRVLDETGGDAIGATVTAKIGSRPIRRDVRVAYSYCTASDPRVHVGLGAATELDDVIVRWPDGRRERFPNIDGVDRIVILRRGEGVPATE